VDDCHWILPVLADKLIVVPLPLQIVPEAAVAVPPTEPGFTVTVTEAVAVQLFASVTLTV
jgi:hypothetical protein